MQYLFLLYADEKGWDQMTADQRKQGEASYTAYTNALREAKIYLGSNRLRPVGDATTVTMQTGQSRVLDGPYADTKEQLGGYYLVELPDLDSAIAWANRCPGAHHGTIEVRPVWTM
jgi:hypothetical protein